LHEQSKLTNLLPFSFQNAKSLIKLTSKTFVFATVDKSVDISGVIKALWMNLKTSQFELAPRTLAKRMSEASGGSAR